MFHPGRGAAGSPIEFAARFGPRGAPEIWPSGSMASILAYIHHLKPSQCRRHLLFPWIVQKRWVARVDSGVTLSPITASILSSVRHPYRYLVVDPYCVLSMFSKHGKMYGDLGGPGCWLEAVFLWSVSSTLLGAPGCSRVCHMLTVAMFIVEQLISVEAALWLGGVLGPALQKLAPCVLDTELSAEEVGILREGVPRGTPCQAVRGMM